MRQKKFIDYGITMFPAPPPAISYDSWYFGFLFETTKGATQAFLDKTLNTALGESKRFRAIGNMVMLNISRNPGMQSSSPQYVTEGMIAENDIGFWIPFFDHGQDADQCSKSSVSLGMMPAYLFVDRGIAVTTGREVWGMPKIHAHMILPEDISTSNGLFTSEVYGLSAMAEGLIGRMSLALALQGERRKTLRIKGTKKRQRRNILHDTISKLGELGENASEELLWHSLLHAVADHGTQSLPSCYMLKQFRAANSQDDACYQEVIKAQLAPTDMRKPFDKLYIDFGEWKLGLPSLASLPFAHDLGLGDANKSEIIGPGTTLTTKICLRVKLNYTITQGSPLSPAKA